VNIKTINYWNRVLGNEAERDKQIVIAYGSAKFAPGGRGEVSVPTTKAFRACAMQKGVRILVVDEFRTSKLHYMTEQLLHLVKIKGDNKHLRGLLWCCSTSSEKQGFFVNRDINAAWNILQLAIAVERPEIFKRSRNLRRLPKQLIKKRIKKQIKVDPAKK
jgi:hypothetical protein